MSSLTGKLIVIEGLEGSGKSTAVATIVELLSRCGIQTLTTREPGGTAIGEQLRSIIKNPEYKNILDDKSELLLFYVARTQLLEEVIKPALEQGIWVIADRFELSTMAYQAGGRGLDKTMIQHLSNFCLNHFKPDMTLYLDISPEDGMKRVALRGGFDRIEQQSIDFFHRVHETYMSYVHDNPEITLINASQPLNQVQDEIRNALNRFIETGHG